MRNVPWTAAGAWNVQLMRHHQEIMQIPGVRSVHLVTSSASGEEKLRDCYVSVRVKPPTDLEGALIEASELSGLPVGVLIAVRADEADGPGLKAFPSWAFITEFGPQFDPSVDVTLPTGHLEIRSSNILTTLPKLLVGLADAAEEGLTARRALIGIQRIDFDSIQLEIRPQLGGGYWLNVDNSNGFCIGAAQSSDLESRGSPGVDLVESLLAARSLNRGEEELQT